MVGTVFNTRLGAYGGTPEEKMDSSAIQKHYSRGGKRWKILYNAFVTIGVFWASERVATTEHSFTG